jgi:hypothetical protein
LVDYNECEGENGSKKSYLGHYVDCNHGCHLVSKWTWTWTNENIIYNMQENIL